WEIRLRARRSAAHRDLTDARPRTDHRLERRFFKVCRPLNGAHEIRDEVIPPLIVVLDLCPLRLHRLIEHYEMVSDADDPNAENDDDENQCAEAADESKSQSVLLFLFFLFRLFFALGLRNDVLFLLGLS